MLNLTPHQQEAIYTHDCNLIVVAGAGSGKTYVLVERYLALLDRNPDWQLNQLVAITFTQKAAQEMRDRVREALQERLYNATDETSINLWSKRLAAMDSARIDTIHALCASILRANAAEAGVDPGFEVLDEVEAQLVLENAIDDALRELVAQGNPALELFREYDARTVREALSEFANVEVSQLPSNLFDVWVTAWHTNADACLQALYQDPEFLSAIEWRPDGGFPNVEDKLLDIWKACEAHIEVLKSTSDIPTHVETLKRLVSEIKLNVGSAGAWGGADTLKMAKHALRIIRESARNTVERIGEYPGESDQRAAELLPHWYVMIQHVQNAYRQAKTDRAALDFDDLERLTRDVLRDHEHVRARYCGKEFKQILVDEFQDTNAIQWEIVRHIASPDLPGILFVVGDPKQSIYAFRGADVSVFESVRAQIATRVGREIPLARSFRTHQILVQGFNTAFSRILVRDERSPVRDYQSTLDTPMEAARTDAPCGEPALEFILLDSETYKGEDERSDKMRRWEA
ncbi:MAG TPA: UvrD-helicase domain-containing protein, partial [Oceanobacillus sp.]|nr:UvrD-helicase domain-containing protein [Oceanobacillus sp.]